MNKILAERAIQVQNILTEKGFDFKVMQLPASTRSAMDAAMAIGCTLGEIAKSIIFRTQGHQQPVLVIASGANQINSQSIENALGESIELPDGKWVKQTLGFAIGGVPPIGFSIPFPVFIDQDLLQYDTIWAAAGTPNAVFCLPACELVNLTGGQIMDLS